MQTESQFPPDPQALTVSLTELISGAYGSPWTDLIAGELSGATAMLVTLDTAPIAFDDIADRWAFVAAFLAAQTATPLPDILNLDLADFILWLRQSARLASGRHQAGLRMITAAAEVLAANASIVTTGESA